MQYSYTKLGGEVDFQSVPIHRMHVLNSDSVLLLLYFFKPVLGKRYPSERSSSWIIVTAELTRLWIQGKLIVGAPNIRILSVIFLPEMSVPYNAFGNNL